MKKKYIIPEMKVSHMSNKSVICTSDPSKFENETLTGEEELPTEPQSGSGEESSKPSESEPTEKESGSSAFDGNNTDQTGEGTNPDQTGDGYINSWTTDQTAQGSNTSNEFISEVEVVNPSTTETTDNNIGVGENSLEESSSNDWD